jgi:hypothetical protein
MWVRPVSRAVAAVMPWLLPVLAACTVLHSIGVAVVQTLLFIVIQVVGYTLPGTLWWRAIRGQADSLVSDLTFGSISAMHSRSACI